MKFVFYATTAALVGLFASCTPYQEPPPVPPTDPASNAATADKEKKKTTDPANNNTASTEEKKKSTSDTPQIPTTPRDPVPVKPDPAPSNPVARRVPGRPGFVYSPFNNKLIDVQDCPSGSLVADPTYPASAKKHFRVP